MGQLETQRPPWQVELPPHTVVQLPQWKRSVWRSTQPVPHTESGGVHDITHWPAAQRAPAGHAAPQRPQLRASELGSTHWPLHSTSGVLHAQLPEMHSSSASHAVPQLPQFRRSEVMSRQRPLQNAWPLGHCCEQVPPWHTAPAPHARPQAPQCASSVWRSAQRPEHVVSPAAHPTTPG